MAEMGLVVTVVIIILLWVEMVDKDRTIQHWKDQYEQACRNTNIMLHEQRTMLAKRELSDTARFFYEPQQEAAISTANGHGVDGC